MAEGTRAS